MPKTLAESSIIRATVHSLEEPDNPAHLIIQFVADYSLPAKILAQLAGVSVQSLYSWVEEGTNVRPTDEVAAKLNRIVDRLKAAEAAGQLVLVGNSKERAALLIEALAIEQEPN